MKKIIYAVIWIVLLNTSFAADIEIFYPAYQQQLCANQPVEIKWNGSAADYIIQVKAEMSEEYKNIFNYSINENVFSWVVNEPDLFGIPLIFRVSDKNNPSNFDEISGITVFPETKILNQTNSLAVCKGEDIVLQIDAVGTGLSYSWYKDGSLIENKKSSVLLVKNADYKNSGIYLCKIDNDGKCPQIASKPISVYIATPTSFQTNPNDVFWYYMGTAKLTAELHANSELDLQNVKFQWYKDTTVFTGWRQVIKIKVNDSKRITGSKSQTLEMKNLVWSDRSNYYCIAEGLCGKDTASCYVGDDTHFRIYELTPGFEDCEGPDVTFKAEVEQFTKGTYTYQWYKTGLKKLEEGEKFSGTNTLELTIHKVKADSDNQAYYVLVTLEEYNVSQRSEHYLIEAKMPPKITQQPRDYIIKDRSNYHYGQTYVDVSIQNSEGCMYTWYRDGVQARKKCHRSDYWLGMPDCPAPGSLMPPPRPAVLEDVGWYKCKIENECGETWSDSAFVSWGYDDVKSCVGKSIAVTVKDLGPDYYYLWKKDGITIYETKRIKNTETSKLIINDLVKEDEGFYSVWAVDIATEQKILLGKIYVSAKTAPYIIKEFPKELVNDGLYMKQGVVTVGTIGPVFYYQLYIDGKPEGPLQEKQVPNLIDNTHPFILGGYNSNLKPGKYKYYFKNDCGEVWSKEMNVINTEYKPGGIVKADDDSDVNEVSPDDDTIISAVYEIENSDEMLIFPNPASNFIDIIMKDDDNSISKKAQIFNIFGVEVMSEIIHLTTGSLRMNIAGLPSGMYYIRIGNRIEKFIKM